MREVPKLKLAGLVILLLLVFFLAPIVPYLQSVSVPGASGGAVDLWGEATPAYAVLGFGSPPYPQQELVTQGNRSALVFFSGGKAAAIEYVGGAGVVLDPSNVVQIDDAIVSSSDWGLLNITVYLTNIGHQGISNPVVYVQMEGASTNSTLGGLAVIDPHVIGDCGTLWAGTMTCTVSQIVPNELPVNESFTFYAEVRGAVGGVPFLYREPFSASYPEGGIGPLWVQAFLSDIDHSRLGIPLTENSTLDAFAAIRFKNASAQYQISDYGFSEDATKYFGQGPFAADLAEELLFPGVYSPDGYASFLEQYAPAHWDEITDTVYTQFGYYVGRAPYYVVSEPCSIYEIPHAGINVPQYFEDQGCAVAVTVATWLVIVMGT